MAPSSRHIETKSFTIYLIRLDVLRVHRLAGADLDMADVQCGISGAKSCKFYCENLEAESCSGKVLDECTETRVFGPIVSHDSI